MMRKRNLDKLFDNIFWYAIYLLPLLVVLAIYACPAFINIELQTNEFFDVSSLVLQAFGAYDGIMFDFFAQCLSYFSMSYESFVIAGLCNYFVICVCMHLIVDFALFIPRIAHKYMDKFVRSE